MVGADTVAPAIANSIGARRGKCEVVSNLARYPARLAQCSQATDEPLLALASGPLRYGWICATAACTLERRADRSKA
jgi:hypothetical protein